jgi:glycosyltransferase involved in cell wall biosynthesis
MWDDGLLKKKRSRPSNLATFITMSSPRFSILIPTYNRQLLLKEAVDSVLAQTFSSYELIVIDNGSTDGTLSMLSSYGSKINTLSESRRGGDVARSRGAAISTGEYIVLLDDDDLFFPNALEVYSRIIEGLSAPALVLGAMAYFRHGSSPRPNSTCDNAIAYRSFVDFLSKDIPFRKANSRIVIKRSIAESTNALRAEPSMFPCDDANLLLLAGTVGPIVIVDKPYTVRYRVHDQNTIGKLAYMADSILAIARREHHGDYPGGDVRRFDRYAFLGGCSLAFVQRALKELRIRLAFKLAFETKSMIVAATINKLGRYFRTATPVSWLRADAEAKN